MSGHITDAQIKEAIDSIDISQMATDEDYPYLIARAVLAIDTPAEAKCVGVVQASRALGWNRAWINDKDAPIGAKLYTVPPAASSAAIAKATGEQQ